MSSLNNLTLKSPIGFILWSSVNMRYPNGILYVCGFLKEKMKPIIAMLLLAWCAETYAGKDISSSVVNFVYQLDSDATVFEFSASVVHDCGTTLYRVKSPNEAVANRKFSLVITAFVSGKRLAFHDTEECEGNRSIVSWVRLIS